MVPFDLRRLGESRRGSLLHIRHNARIVGFEDHIAFEQAGLVIRSGEMPAIAPWLHCGAPGSGRRTIQIAQYSINAATAQISNGPGLT